MLYILCEHIFYDLHRTEHSFKFKIGNEEYRTILLLIYESHHLIWSFVGYCKMHQKIENWVTELETFSFRILYKMSCFFLFDTCLVIVTLVFISCFLSEYSTCSKYFDTLIWISSQNKQLRHSRYLVCRWFRFAQLAKGKKSRP